MQAVMRRALNSVGDGSKQNGGRLMQKEKEKVGEGDELQRRKGKRSKQFSSGVRFRKDMGCAGDVEF